MPFNKKYLLRPGFITIYIIAILIISAIILTVFQIRDINRKIDILISDTRNISDTVNIINADIVSRLAQRSTAELLMNNTNLILSTVYFGTADSDTSEETRDFTAFSIMYKDKYYIITAGHSVEMDGLKYKNFKFKANNKNNFITPPLIEYCSDYSNNVDYAIFYDPHIIRTGLYPAGEDEDNTPQYVLGNLKKNINLVKRYKDARQGESGSPVINSKCHVVGIMIKKDGEYTPIEIVLEAIDRLAIE